MDVDLYIRFKSFKRKLYLDLVSTGNRLYNVSYKNIKQRNRNV